MQASESTFNTFSPTEILRTFASWLYGDHFKLMTYNKESIKPIAYYDL
jgi:hypothetical protein